MSAIRFQLDGTVQKSEHDGLVDRNLHMSEDRDQKPTVQWLTQCAVNKFCTSSRVRFAVKLCASALILGMVVYLWPAPRIDADASWNDQNVLTSELNGDRVMDLLAAYRKAHGNFPPSLQTLSDEGNVLPTPVAGDSQWDYRNWGDWCWLEFSSATGLKSRSRTSIDAWQGSEKSL